MLSLPHTVPNAKARFPLRLYFYSVPLGEGVGHSVTGVFALSTFSLGNYYAFWGYLLWYEMGVWLIIFAYVILHTFSEWIYFVNSEQYMCSTMCVCVFSLQIPKYWIPTLPANLALCFRIWTACVILKTTTTSLTTLRDFRHTVLGYYIHYSTQNTSMDVCLVSEIC